MQWICVNQFINTTGACMYMVSEWHQNGIIEPPSQQIKIGIVNLPIIYIIDLVTSTRSTSYASSSSLVPRPSHVFFTLCEIEV